MIKEERGERGEESQMKTGERKTAGLYQRSCSLGPLPLQHPGSYGKLAGAAMPVLHDMINKRHDFSFTF